MKKIIIIFLLLISCTTTKYVVKEVTKYTIPKIICPIPHIPTYEKYKKGDTKKEYLDKLTSNMDKASKFIKQLKQSIRCFEENLKLFKEKTEKRNK